MQGQHFEWIIDQKLFEQIAGSGPVSSENLAGSSMNRALPLRGSGQQSFSGFQALGRGQGKGATPLRSRFMCLE